MLLLSRLRIFGHTTPDNIFGGKIKEIPFVGQGQL